MRSFETWKTEIITWLIRVKAEDEKFDEMRNYLISRAETLSFSLLSAFIADLYRALRAYKIEIPEHIIPTEKEIEMWAR